LGTTFGLRSTGLTVFAGRIISAFTGLLFTVMVTHWLLTKDVGLWEVIVDLVTFSAYPVGLVAFWVTRDVARGRMVGRTALLLGGAISGVGLALYFGLTFVTSTSLAASIVPFLLGALLVPLSYWSAVANSIVQGYRPTAYGYSLVVSELAKLAVAYEALYVFRLAILGVILALMTSYLVQAAVSTYLVRGTTVQPFDTALASRWGRLGWLPLVSYLPTVVAVADTYVASVSFGLSVVGYYQAAFIIASVVGYSSALAFSLYPLLLKGGGVKLPALTVEFSLLFSLPMASGLIALSGPILVLLGPSSDPLRYLPASEGLQILAAMFVLSSISLIIDQTLLGTERVDENENVTYVSLARSNLLFVPVANVSASALYIGSMYGVLYYSFASGLSFAAAVALWGVVELLSTLVILLVKARRAKGVARLLPDRNVVYYLGAAALMGLVVYLASGFVVDGSSASFYYGLRLLVLVVLGGAVYFGIVYAVDPKVRRMARVLLG
jgi:hypothetical protein